MEAVSPERHSEVWEQRVVEVIGQLLIRHVRVMGVAELQAIFPLSLLERLSGISESTLEACRIEPPVTQLIRQRSDNIAVLVGNADPIAALQHHAVVTLIREVKAGF